VGAGAAAVGAGGDVDAARRDDDGVAEGVGADEPGEGLDPLAEVGIVAAGGEETAVVSGEW